MTKTFPRGFIERTNEEYAAWCKTFYNPSALDHRGMPGLHGLWAWQEQERRKVKEWQPIETAPKDNKRPLYLARIDAQGKILELAHDAIWEYWQESWEMPHINGYAWESVGGIEEPTHWAYQDEGPPPPETAGAPDGEPVPSKKVEDWRDWRGTILPTFKDPTEHWVRSNIYVATQLREYGDVHIFHKEVATWTDDQCQEAEAWATAMKLYRFTQSVRPPRPPIHLLAHPRMRSVHWDDQEG